MKINFLGAFRDVSKLARAPIEQENPLKEAGEHFGTLLGDLIQPDKATSILESKEIKTVEADDSDEQSQAMIGAEPMARFHFPEPQPMLPEVAAAEISGVIEQGSLTEKTQTEPDTVKSPSILSARRIQGETPFVEKTRDERIAEVKDMLHRSGKEQGIDPLLGIAVVNAESAFNSRAVSTDGHASKGLFQLLDTTGKELVQKMGGGQDYDPFNPQQNVELGVGYLRRLHEIFSEPTTLANNITTRQAANSSSLEKLAVAAFNAGEGRVASAQQRAEQQGVDPSNYDHVAPYLPETTQEYVEKVMGYKADFEGEFSDFG